MKNWPHLKGNKLFLYKQQRGNCWLCHKHMYPPDVTYDHVVPVSSGGSDHIRNLRVAHSWCNNQRGTMGLYSMKCL